MPASDTHYFGIRHHGPGSAARLVKALDALAPSVVLIEGPSDCSELLPLLAHADMRPPVSLLAYHAEQAERSLYYPFAEFSPEYQACRWAVARGATLAFIDLPVSIQLATPEDDTEGAIITDRAPAADSLASDPIGALARLAGYEDGESWWNDLIEQNRDTSRSIFDHVEMAMSALRERVQSDVDASTTPDREQQREAHREAWMRAQIASYQSQTDGPIAVVCGAWHVPAFRQAPTLKADQRLLKSLPKSLAAAKVKATWVPWTTPRLASASGYGAGVPAPLWYQHLWDRRDDEQAHEFWMVKVAMHLRTAGYPVSTASLIEALRLSQSLAALRGRPQAGFEELREATISCLCFGEALLWQHCEADLLLGDQVGVIPDSVPLAPLLEDMQKQQKAFRLSLSAVPKELSLDLRTPAGLGKSTLLHRLNLLDVPWGKLIDAGGSRGTFRERWQLQWQPEYAVRLVENLVYGSTIEQAAGRRLAERMRVEMSLAELASAVQQALESQLDATAEHGLSLLEICASKAGDCSELLDSLAPLVRISRYGTARALSLTHLDALLEQLVIQSALALPYACRNLDAQEAGSLRRSLMQAHEAVLLAELTESVVNSWWLALQAVVHDRGTSASLAGLSARLLYQDDRIDSEALQRLLQRALSPAVSAPEAAAFFEGFFSETVSKLLYDSVLLQAVEAWFIQLEEDDFMAHLPLFRRIFSELDSMERRRLFDAVTQTRQTQQDQDRILVTEHPRWPAHRDACMHLLQPHRQSPQGEVHD